MVNETPKTSREDRLAAKLRENLYRRKARVRAQASQSDENPGLPKGGKPS